LLHLYGVLHAQGSKLCQERGKGFERNVGADQKYPTNSPYKTAVLANHVDSSTSTAAKIHTEEVSKHGGTHATMLCGMICHNKDKKKGQHNMCDWYMEIHIGQPIPYPDISKTRDRSHGKVAATIIVYCTHFINFIQYIQDRKDRPDKTNIEKNFSNAIQDIPTLTGLCILALYNIAVLCPFMCHVQLHGNILHL